MFLRKFIILNKQSSENAKGHVRIESRGERGRMTLSLEEIRFSEDLSYKLSLVADEKRESKEIDLGTVDISKSGRGKLDITFSSKSVANSGIDLGDFNIVLIKRTDNGSKSTKVILGGYIHAYDSTMSKVISKSEIDVEEEKEAPKKQSLETEASIKEQNKVIEKVQEDITEDEKFNTFEFKEQSQLEEKEEIKETEQIKQEAESDKTTAEMDYETEDSDTYMDSVSRHSKGELDRKHSFKNYSEQISNYTLNLLEFFKEIQPFKVELKDYKWWRIDYDEINSDRGFLPYYGYVLDLNHYRYSNRYSTCQNQIKRYNHYLFGVVEKKEKITHYVYAIPGRYEKNEQPYGGKTGFVTWLEDNKNLNTGYWLVYIDAYSGNVVRPL